MFIICIYACIYFIMKVIIHRGITSYNIKENSYISIKKALNDSDSCGVEFDIRLTKDNKIVLSHDSLIGSNIIEYSNYNEILKEKYLDTLDKILTIDTNKILLIDIKVNDNYKMFANVILEELKDTKMEIYLTSFNKKIIKYLHTRTKLKTGITSTYYKRNNYYLKSINRNFIKIRQLKKIKNREIFLWTIDSKKEKEKIEKNFGSIPYIYLIMNKEE